MCADDAERRRVSDRLGDHIRNNGTVADNHVSTRCRIPRVSFALAHAPRIFQTLSNEVSGVVRGRGIAQKRQIIAGKGTGRRRAGRFHVGHDSMVGDGTTPVESPSSILPNEQATTSKELRHSVLEATRTAVEHASEAQEFSLSAISTVRRAMWLSAASVSSERVSVFTRSGMTRAIARLEKLGLVERTPSPSDKRSMLVSLTPEGKCTQQEAAVITQEHGAQLFGAVATADERRRVEQIGLDLRAEMGARQSEMIKQEDEDASPCGR